MIMAANEKRKSIGAKAKNLAQRQLINSFPRTVGHRNSISAASLIDGFDYFFLFQQTAICALLGLSYLATKSI
jgi:hypothetical protein